jgi:NAD+ synthase
VFSPEVLAIDAPAVTEQITRAIESQVRGTLRRRGAVVGLSGGVDSSVVAALCTRALGPNRVLGLFMPERDSSDDSLRLGQILAAHLGIDTITENIGPILDAAGCYRRQIEAIRQVFPEYGEGWKCKLTLPSILDSDRFNVFQLTVESPGDEPGGPRVMTSRMPPAAYLQLVAATNFKQRIRKNIEYYHADRLMHAVAGTPNRLEYDQGFFVKNGDGSADFKPIAHLYKTQVYQLAAYLGLPEEIRSRPPTTDTFSMAQTQEEFYFSLPYREMDLCLYAHNHSVPAAEVASALGLTAAQIGRVYRDIEAKRRTTQYLHLAPLFVDKVSEVSFLPAETSASPAARNP